MAFFIIHMNSGTTAPLWTLSIAKEPDFGRLFPSAHMRRSPDICSGLAQVAKSAFGIPSLFIIVSMTFLMIFKGKYKPDARVPYSYGKIAMTVELSGISFEQACFDHKYFNQLINKYSHYHRRRKRMNCNFW